MAAAAAVFAAFLFPDKELPAPQSTSLLPANFASGPTSERVQLPREGDHVQQSFVGRKQHTGSDGSVLQLPTLSQLLVVHI